MDTMEQGGYRLEGGPMDGQWSRKLPDGYRSTARFIHEWNHVRAKWKGDQVTRDTDPSGWRPTRWWRVIAPDGSVWAETSDEDEARSRVRPGDRLERLFERRETEWRQDR